MSCPITGKNQSQNPCTEQCIRGTIHAGNPVGHEAPIHGLNTYITGNQTSPRGIIVVYSDVFGLPLVNNKLLADAYAASSQFLVYMPDFFKGDPVPLKTADVLIPADASKQSTLGKYTGMLAAAPQFVMWMTRHGEKATHATFVEWMGKLRAEMVPQGKKIGVVGLCWGGRYAIRAALEKNMVEVEGQKVSLVDAAVALHPSNLSLPEDVEGVVVPVTIGWGLKDEGVKYELKRQIEEIHGKVRTAGEKLAEVEHKTYEPGRHGFAIRGNPDDPAERKCQEDSLAQGLQWFDRWL